MSCDTQREPNQTITQRKEQIRDTVLKLARALVTGQVKAIVNAQGAIAFQGWTDRNRVTDACAYRQIMATGTALAKMKIAQAEALAGKSVSRQAIGHGGAGTHSHDGGKTWHNGH